MDFAPSPRAADLTARVRDFIDTQIEPREAEIREGISGNICRCTGYKNIVAAIQWAAENPATTDAEVTA